MRELKSGLIGVCLFAMFYLIGSFIEASFNINIWQQITRGIIGAAGGVFTIMLTIMHYDLSKK